MAFMVSSKNGKRSHGGLRKGAGRKPVSDPKIAVTIYVEESFVKEIVGVEEVKNECYVCI